MILEYLYYHNAFITLETLDTHLHVVKTGFQHVRAGVASVEEHQLCFLQVAGGQALLKAPLRTKQEKDVSLEAVQITLV